MNRIDAKFKELKEKGKKGFIAYITAGDPAPSVTEKLVPALERSGVDFVELGVPFSDPLADGLTNQRAAERALASGVTLKKVLEIVTRIRRSSQIPIILFTYLNPVFRFGWLNFAKEACLAGVDGILVLDLPPEESKDARDILAVEGIKMIHLIAPTTTKERMKLICQQASGFLYYVSRTGVTGMRKSVETGVRPMVAKIKRQTKLPVAGGFGISDPRQVKEVARYADAIVVGSAIVNQIEANLGKENLVSRTAKFISTLTKGLS